MKDAGIFILTRGRADRQITLNNLPPILWRHTYLVVEKEEETSHAIRYGNKVRIIPFPKGYGNFLIEGSGNFSDKKQWTVEWINKNNMESLFPDGKHLQFINYFFFVDDDLKFDIRRNGKLKPAKGREVYNAFKSLYHTMRTDGYAHVAMSPREGNNWVESNYQIAGRAMRICGFDLETIKKHKLKFNRTVLMADFDITLQLLELGYPNQINYKYANGQRKSNDDGGCSLYRTPERMREAAHALHKLHPKFVTVKEKKTSKPWAGFDTNTRTDVQVSWKKAYNFGKGRRKRKRLFKK